MSNSVENSSLGALCGQSIRSTVTAIEQELDVKKAELYWNALLGTMCVSQLDKIVVALVYKYYFHKPPPKFISSFERLENPGVSDLRKIKTMYKEAVSVEERFKILKKVCKEDIGGFMCTMIKSDQIQVTRTEITWILKGLYKITIENVEKGVKLMNLEENLEETESIPYWRLECVKLYNTINSVLKGIKPDEKCKKFVEDISESQRRLKSLLEVAVDKETGLDEDVLWSSWLECISNCFSNPDYTHLKGLNYSLFKNMANRALAIKESSGY
ncbi:ML [Sinu virus]|uniref:ML n=1 Tax=Sinu virus TaxID=1927799 RepID=A0A1L5YKF8_9ORTO|nr:ML [Sinu virus]APP91609.1 ML [Sinu virus]